MAKSKTNKKKLSKPKRNVQGRFSLLNILEYKHTGLIISGVYLLVVGIISYVFHKVGDYGVETDFFWSYVPSAKEFLNGNIPIDAFRGPLYPMVLGIIGFLISDFFHAGMLIAVISASVFLFVSFKMLKKIFTSNISFFVTLLIAVNEVFIQYSYSAGTDMFFNALAALTLFFFFKDKELNYRNLIIAGIVGGLSYLTRYNGIFLASFIFVILFVNYWNLKWSQRIKSSIIFVAVFLITIAPWGFHTLSEKGSFFYNENYKNIAYEVYGKGKMSWDDFWFGESSNITSLTEVVFKDFGLFFSTIANNVADHFVNDMDKLLGWHIGVFVILGLIMLVLSNPFKEWKGKQTAYYIVNLSFFLLLLLLFYSERFSIFLIPFYLVIAIQPLFVEKFRIAKIINPVFRYLLLVTLIAISFINSYSFNGENINSGPEELLILKEWYQQNVPDDKKGSVIAARKAHVAYYLDMKFSLMPMADSYDQFIKKLRENNIDYLYFGIAEAGLRRELQFLIDPKSNHPGLEVVVFFNEPPSVLYRVVK